MQCAAVFGRVDRLCFEHGAKLIVNVAVLGQRLQSLQHGSIYPLMREVQVNATVLQAHR